MSKHGIELAVSKAFQELRACYLKIQNFLLNDFLSLARFIDQWQTPASIDVPVGGMATIEAERPY